MFRFLPAAVRFVFLPGLLLIYSLIGCTRSVPNPPAASAPGPMPNSPPELMQQVAPATAPLPTEITAGFFQPDDALVPEGVRKAMGSVFEIYVPLNSKARDVDVRLWIAPKVRAEIASSSMSVNAKIAALKQVEACERSRGYSGRVGFSDSTCKISFNFLRATAFVTGDGSLLWTSWRIMKHAPGITDAIKAVTSDNLKSPTAVPFFVFSGEGQLAYDSLTESFSPERFHPDADKKYFTFIYVPNADFIAVRLARPLATGLKLASHGPRPDTKVFGLGVPDCTGCGYSPDDHDHADRIPYPNADGHSVRATYGIIEATPDISMIRPLNLAERAQFTEIPLIFAEMDSNFGMLGGPVVNHEGEVLALTTYTKNIVDNGKIRRTVLMVLPPEVIPLDPTNRNTVDNGPRNQRNPVVEPLGRQTAQGI